MSIINNRVPRMVRGNVVFPAVAQWRQMHTREYVGEQYRNADVKDDDVMRKVNFGHQLHDTLAALVVLVMLFMIATGFPVHWRM